MKLVGYGCRSTAEQAQGVSIEVQRRAVGRAAESSAGRISAPSVPRSQALEWMRTWRTCGRRWRCRRSKINIRLLNTSD